MNLFLRFLILIRLKTIQGGDVFHWIEKGNIEMLIVAVKNGFFFEKMEAIKGLKELADASVIPEILPLAKKESNLVADEIIQTIQSLDKDLIYEDQIKRLIENRKLHENFKPKYDIKPLVKKDRMKRLEQLKRMLRRN